MNRFILNETSYHGKGALAAVADEALTVDKEKATAKVVALPARDDIDIDINEQLIVELYSK